MGATTLLCSFPPQHSFDYPHPENQTPDNPEQAVRQAFYDLMGESRSQGRQIPGERWDLDNRQLTQCAQVMSVGELLPTNKKQTRQAGSLLTVDIQTSFHLIFVLLDLEVALIQSPHCADWHSKHLSVRISRCPPPGPTCGLVLLGRNL